MLKLRIFIGVLVAAVAFGRASSNPTDDIGGRPATAALLRTVTLNDAINLRVLQEPVLSSDGKSIAYLVRQASLQCNCYRTSLYVVAVDGRSPAKKIASESSLSNVRWRPGKAVVSFLTSAGNPQNFRAVDIATGRMDAQFSKFGCAKDVASARHGCNGTIVSYEWSNTGDAVAFVVSSPVDAKEKAEVEKAGVRYDDTVMQYADIVLGNTLQSGRAFQLRVFDARAKTETLLWETRVTYPASIQNVAWSPDGRSLLFSYYDPDTVPNGAYKTVLASLQIKTHELTKLGSNYSEPAQTSVSPDGSLTAAYWGGRSDNLDSIELFEGQRLKRSIRINLLAHHSLIGWSADGAELFLTGDGIGQKRANSGLYSLSTKTGLLHRRSPDALKVSDCGAVRDNYVACVVQSPSVRPRLASISMKTQRITYLVDPNPELSNVQLAPVEELLWKNKYGEPANGYLLLPTQTVRKRLPLVVMAYGFTGAFVLDADRYLTSYPAQMLARDGVAVLLINFPEYKNWQGANYSRGSRAYGYGPLSTVKVIVSRLVKKGLVDSSRVGFAGHSRGGFWVQFALTKSDLFSVAELHNGGTLAEPGTYWIIGSADGRALQDHIMGGPPYGRTLKNYLEFSPALHAERVHAPVLINAEQAEAVDQLEFFSALRTNNMPVEMYIYPGDGHVFFRPSYRYASMQRTEQWFRFWLQGVEEPGSEKREQYQRWERLCRIQSAHTASTRIHCLSPQ